jgi:hypothetical protein
MSDLLDAMIELIAACARPRRRLAKVAVGGVLVMLTIAMVAAFVLEECGPPWLEEAEPTRGTQLGPAPRY